MSLKTIANSLNRRAQSIHETTRILNIACSELNGVAAVVPKSVPSPLNSFAGSKVILRNVSFDKDAGAIRASITVPYKKDVGPERYYSGTKYGYFIDENWFND